MNESFISLRTSKHTQGGHELAEELFSDMPRKLTFMKYKSHISKIENVTRDVLSTFSAFSAVEQQKCHLINLGPPR